MKRLISDIVLILTIHCELASKLMSEGKERELTRAERMAIKFHLMICRPCTLFNIQRSAVEETAIIAKAGQLGAVALEEAAPERVRLPGAFVLRALAPAPAIAEQA